jgi:hypothetical protein
VIAMVFRIFALLPLTAFLVNVMLGIYLLYRNSKDLRNRLYSIMTFSLAIWSIMDFFVFSSPDPDKALICTRITIFGSSLMPALLLHFFLVFTKKKITKKHLVLVYGLIPAFVFLGIGTNLITRGEELAYWEYNPL